MAELTAELEARLRRRLGDNGTVEIFTTEELEDIYVEASDSQSTDGLIFQQAVVIGYEELLADSAKRVTYKANQSSENLSDTSKALEKLLAYHQKKLAELEAGAVGSPASYAAIKPRDTRWKDLPSA